MEQSLRETLTFAQAEGAEPLPQQLKLREVSQQLRATLWSEVFAQLVSAKEYDSNYNLVVGDPWFPILLRKHIFCDHMMADELDRQFGKLASKVKQIFQNGSYIDVFDFIQFVLRDQDCPYDFEELVSQCLRESRAAYRIVNKTIIPIASEEEGQAIESAVAELSDHGMVGAREHIIKASQCINNGQWADSIRESIHAVEAAARMLEPSAKTLDPALKALKEKARLHPALVKGFGSLYGFSNDEKGIRHPLIDEPVASVDEADALYMLGSCASFVTYILSKSESLQIDEEREL